MSEIELTKEDLCTINRLVNRMYEDKNGYYSLSSPDRVEFYLPSSMCLLDVSREHRPDICESTVSISYIEWNYDKNNVDIFLRK